MILLLLMSLEKGWSSDLKREEIAEMIGSESTLEAEEVGILIEEILEICDEESLILLEEQEKEHLEIEMELQDQVNQREKRLQIWKRIVWMESAFLAGVVAYNLWENR